MGWASSPERIVLYGRERETVILDDMLSRAAEYGDAVVVRGEPGIGKSSLIAATSAQARDRGFQILTATGVESEAEVPFAGLHRLLRPIPWTADTLPSPQREAMLAAFGRSSSAAPDLYLVAIATLDLLSDAASRSPTLVVAEDAQWLDHPTCDVLTFIARRLESDPILLLIAVREGCQSTLLDAGLKELRLAGLAEAGAAALLDRHAPRIGPAIRRRLLDEADGNPLAVETAESVWAAGAQAMKAILAAVRGEPDGAVALTLDAERAVVSTGASHMLAYVRVARGLAALGEGRHADAYDELRRIYDRADPAHHLVPCCWYVGDLAEAAAHSDHREAARALVEEMAPLIEQTSSSWIRAAMRYARAQLADDAEAEPLFRAALDADIARWPFQRARLLLAYGAWLRRQRRAAESRTPLRAARDTFDALGVVQWAERARQELRAAGELSRRRTTAVWDRLSPQEIQIAAMAAEGLSNREIGRKLYLSHRTVGSHLYRIFPKLGVTSRAQLRGALTTG